MLARSVPLWLGLFTLSNLTLAGVLGADVDVNGWWIDLGLSGAVEDLVLGALGAGLVVFGLGLDGRWERFGRGACWVACLVCGWNGATYLALKGAGVVEGPIVPLSWCLGLGLMLAALERTAGTRWRWGTTVGLAGLTVAFPLSQMVTFGWTDYRRPADAIVVFGARAYADGSPSLALYDRVRTGCDLYHQGLAPLVVMSGGPGDGAVHETEAMRRLAIRLGVPEEAIAVDRGGLSTRDTVAGTAALARSGRVLAVSHGFHVPRIKLAYRQAGAEVRTVPARESRVLASFAYLHAREVAAWWAYYAGPLIR